MGVAGYFFKMCVCTCVVLDDQKKECVRIFEFKNKRLFSLKQATNRKDF